MGRPTMSEITAHQKKDWMNLVALGLAFVLVMMGMANNLPNIPGLLEVIKSIPGLGELPRLSKYNSEFFFPLTFAIMLLIALMGASFTKAWHGRPAVTRGLGIALDVVMGLAILSMVTVYLIEHEQVCLIDTLSGERARLSGGYRCR